MLRNFKKIFVFLITAFSLYYWHQNYYLEEELSMTSLKCSHADFAEINFWYLLKRKRKEHTPNSIHAGPWVSKRFSLVTKETKIVEIGRIQEASSDFLIFNMNENHPSGKISLNRKNLKLDRYGKNNFSYACEIRNVGEFWLHIKQELEKKKRRLKI